MTWMRTMHCPSIHAYLNRLLIVFGIINWSMHFCLILRADICNDKYPQLAGEALRDNCNTMWCWHQERDSVSFPYYSRLSLLLPRNCRCNPSSSSFAYTLLLLSLLTPHFDNVAFNQLSLGILAYFDGQWDGAGRTISSLCQLHVIHPFNFPRCTLFGGQLYWNGWDPLWAMKCGSSLIRAVGSHLLVHVWWLLNPYRFTTPRYEMAEL